MIMAKKTAKKDQEIILHALKGRGLSLYRAVSLSIDKNSDIATRAGYQPNTMYGHFHKTNLSDAIMVKYGKAIPYDFSIEYPELAPYFRNHLIEQPKSSQDLKRQLEETQQKYTMLLETHNELLKENNYNKEQLINAREEIKELSKEVETLRKKVR